MKYRVCYLLFMLFIPIIVIAEVIGDIDGDGKLGSSDYILLRKHLLKTQLLSADKIKIADINNDGIINSQDYIVARKSILEGKTTATMAPKVDPTTVPTITNTPTVAPTITITPTQPPTPVPISATCEATVKDGKTTITVKANKKIIKYKYNGVDSTNNPYVINSSSSSNKVILYDSDNQSKEITCNTQIIEDSKLEIHFIKALGFYDDAIFIRSNKASIFIDGGRGKEAILEYLKELKITDIDYIIGSHTEYDHIDAEGDIIKTFNVGRVLYANDIYSCGCRCEDQDVRSVKSGLKDKNMKAEVQSVPSKLQIGDMTLFFIAPSKLGCNKNNNSLVFILQFGNNKFMFTGDSDSPLQDIDTLTQNAKSLGLSDIQVDVVKYPHHGNEWLSDKFIEATNAKYYAVPNNGKCDVPRESFYNRANPRGIITYRQCDSTTRNFVITSDGNNIKFTLDTVPSTYAR